MNDWLNYKGSGSGRANLNTLEHAAPVLNGGKINAIRDSAKEAAEKIRGAKYDSINKELDALYAQAQAQVARRLYMKLSFAYCKTKDLIFRRRYMLWVTTF